MQNLTDAPKPPAFDIFRIYRANHQDALFDAEKQPEIKDPVGEVRAEPSNIVDRLTGSKPFGGQSDVVKLVSDSGKVSSALDESLVIFDANAALQKGRVFEAEQRLERKVTDQEIAARQVTKGRYMPDALDERGRALLELKREKLKQSIKAEQMKQEALIKKFHAIKSQSTFLSKPSIAAVFTPTSVNVSSDDEIDLTSASDVFVEQTNDMVEVLQTADETESIATTELAPTVVGMRLGLAPDPDDFEERKQQAPEVPDATGMDPYKYVPWNSKGIEPQKRTQGVNKNEAERILEHATMIPPEERAQVREVLDEYKRMKAGPLLDAVDQAHVILEHVSAKYRGQKQAERETKAEKKGVGMRGRGLKTLDPTKYTPFGRYSIHLPSLEKGKLRIVSASGSQVPTIKLMRISPEYKSFIQSWLENPNCEMTLNKEDQAHWTFLFEIAQLGRAQQILPPAKNKKAVQNRVQVLMGEIVAGNDGQSVIEELTNLVKNTATSGYFTPAELSKLREFISV